MKRFRVTKWIDPVYTTEIYLLLGDRQKYGKWCKRMFNDDDVNKLFIAEAFGAGNGQRKMFGVWFEEWKFKQMYLTTLVHETMHLTHRIFDYVGIRADATNSEPWAYFQEYLFQEMLNRLERWARAK